VPDKVLSPEHQALISRYELTGTWANSYRKMAQDVAADVLRVGPLTLAGEMGGIEGSIGAEESFPATYVNLDNRLSYLSDLKTHLHEAEQLLESANIARDAIREHFGKARLAEEADMIRAWNKTQIPAARLRMQEEWPPAVWAKDEARVAEVTAYVGQMAQRLEQAKGWFVRRGEELEAMDAKRRAPANEPTRQEKKELVAEVDAEEARLRRKREAIEDRFVVLKVGNKFYRVTERESNRVAVDRIDGEKAAEAVRLGVGALVASPAGDLWTGAAHSGGDRFRFLLLLSRILSGTTRAKEPVEAVRREIEREKQAKNAMGVTLESFLAAANKRKTPHDEGLLYDAWIHLEDPTEWASSATTVMMDVSGKARELFDSIGEFANDSPRARLVTPTGYAEVDVLDHGADAFVHRSDDPEGPPFVLSYRKTGQAMARFATLEEARRKLNAYVASPEVQNDLARGVTGDKLALKRAGQFFLGTDKVEGVVLPTRTEMAEEAALLGQIGETDLQRLARELDAAIEAFPEDKRPSNSVGFAVRVPYSRFFREPPMDGQGRRLGDVPSNREIETAIAALKVDLDVLEEAQAKERAREVEVVEAAVEKLAAAVEEAEAEEQALAEEEEAPRGGREDFEERRDRRIGRLRALGNRLIQEADEARGKSRAIGDRIPFGQPILVGHHSEKRARRDAERLHELMGKSISLREKGQEYLAMAERAEKSRAISSDDPDAARKLRREIEQAKKLQEIMVIVNRAIRAAGKSYQAKIEAEKDPQAKSELRDAWAAQAFAAAEAQVRAIDSQTAERLRASTRELLNPDFAGRIGFVDYRLSNNSADIRRMENRLESLQKIAETEAAGVRIKIGDAELRREENRVRVLFPTRVSREAFELFRSRGFVAAPGVAKDLGVGSCFQRKDTEQAWYLARDFAKQIARKSGLSDEEQTIGTPERVVSTAPAAQTPVCPRCLDIEPGVPSSASTERPLGESCSACEKAVQVGRTATERETYVASLRARAGQRRRGAPALPKGQVYVDRGGVMMPARVVEEDDDFAMIEE